MTTLQPNHINPSPSPPSSSSPSPSPSRPSPTTITTRKTANPPTTYSDFDSLSCDLSTLLFHPALCDTHITIDQTKVPLPSQILRARSPYFSALLSSRWHSTHRPLSKPNTTPSTFTHLLNHLLTSQPPPPLPIPQTLSLYLLANELHAPHLESHLLSRISTTLTTTTLPHYIRSLQALSPPPHPLEALLVTFLSAHVASLPTLANGDWQLMRTLWRLLINAHATAQLPQASLSAASRTIARFSALVQGRLKRLPELLADETPTDRRIMLDFLRHASPLTFAQAIEPYNLFTAEQMLEKYRADATAARAAPASPARFRVLCESTHPHAVGSCLESSVRHVQVPGAGLGLRDSLLRFDRRCCLGGGAELAFYTRDPRLGTHPYTFLVGRRLVTELVLPGTEFWYAFASPEFDGDSDSPCRARWGWRFFVEAVVPEIDDVD